MVIAKLLNNPGRAFTVNEIKNTFSVNRETARLDLKRLEEMGLLSSKKEGKKQIIYTRSPNFDSALKKLKSHLN